MEHLTLPGTLDSLEAVTKYVISAAAEAGLDKKASYKLRLAVDEIATNIITHGYEEAGLQGTLDISAEIDQSQLTLKIEDTGVAFDPYSRAMPSEEYLQKDLSERSMGGLGILLAVQNVDQFVYQREDNRNLNIFIVRRKSE